MQAARRSGSLERQQLSPSLMQHIQRVQQKPAATHRQREPAGWGMGSPAASSPGWQASCSPLPVLLSAPLGNQGDIYKTLPAEEHMMELL